MTELQALSHQEQMEAVRRDFQNWWQRQTEIPRTPAAEIAAWKRWRKDGQGQIRAWRIE